MNASVSALAQDSKGSAPVQVGVYNYQKLQMLRAKASLSTTKDMEKQGAKEPATESDAAPLLASDKHTPATNGYTSYRYARLQTDGSLVAPTVVGFPV